MIFIANRVEFVALKYLALIILCSEHFKLVSTGTEPVMQ
jgi:hypothetical protein